MLYTKPAADTTAPMELTAKELAVLTAIDDSEYGDELKDDVWTFTISDNSDLIPRSIPGIVASLVKKGLVTVGRSDGTDTIGITDKGVAAYCNASAHKKPVRNHPGRF